MYLFAAVLSPNTLKGDDINALDGLNRTRARLDQFAEAVTAIKSTVNTIVTTLKLTKGNYVSLVVAPEYFFAKNPSAQSRFIEHGEKIEVVHRLTSLSRQFEDAVLIPGTVPWWRPAHMGNTPTDKQRTDKTINRLKTARGYAYQGNNNILNAVGWSHAQPTNNTYTEPVWEPPKANEDDAFNLLEDSSKNAYIAQNSAYIGCNGKVLKYHKIGSFREVYGESDHTVVFAPGNQCGTFTVGNIRFAFEICRDHAVAVQKTLRPQPAHIHVIVSATIGNIAKNVNVVNGGVIVHADSHQDTSNIPRVSWLPPTQLQNTAPMSKLNGKFHILRINDGISGITPTGDMQLRSATMTYSEPPPVRQRSSGGHAPPRMVTRWQSARPTALNKTTS